jgi:hypothetical protein
MKSVFVLPVFILIVFMLPISCTKSKQNEPVSYLIVDAGPDRQVILPRDTLTLKATADAVNTTTVGYSWYKTNGPSSGIIISPTYTETLLTGLVMGLYTFRFVATDIKGRTTDDYVKVAVYDTTGGACMGCWDY